MKTFTMYGSHVCPDTIEALLICNQAGAEQGYRDISGTMIFLKEFLSLRDGNPVFEPVKARGGIGVPCFVFEDGTVLLDVKEALSYAKK